MRRRLILIVSVIAGLMAAASSASADTTIASVARPTPLSAFNGRLAWSQFDPATGLYLLMSRANGVTARVPVAPRKVPFDLDLGPGPNGNTLAAYARCRREPRPPDPRISNAIAHQIPNWRTGRRCDLFEFDFDTGTERRIAGASSRGASEFLPSISGKRIAFSRVYERRRGRAGSRPYLYLRSPGRRTRRLAAGPRSRLRFIRQGQRGPGKPLLEPGPTALDLQGQYLAFAWDWGDNSGPLSDVRLNRLDEKRPGRAGRLIQRTGSGDIQAMELISPTISVGRVNYAESAFGDSTFTRYRRYVTATHALEDAEVSRDRAFLWTVIDPAGTIFSLQPSGTDPSCDQPLDIPGAAAGCPIVQTDGVSFTQIDDGGRRCARRRSDGCFLASR